VLHLLQRLQQALRDRDGVETDGELTGSTPSARARTVRIAVPPAPDAAARVAQVAAAAV
jgi:hypothetical protein